MRRLMEAMISSIDGSDGDFPTGIEAPEKFRTSWAQTHGFANTAG